MRNREREGVGDSELKHLPKDSVVKDTKREETAQTVHYNWLRTPKHTRRVHSKKGTRGHAHFIRLVVVD